MRTVVQQLTDAIAAVCPIHGVSANNDGTNVRVDYKAEATQGQRNAAVAIVTGWDWSLAAEVVRKTVALRQQAQVALDSQMGETIAIDRVIVRELLNYENNMRQAFNDLLAWLGAQATLVNRPQLAAMQRAQATPAQALTAIKARLQVGEGD